MATESTTDRGSGSALTRDPGDGGDPATRLKRVVLVTPRGPDPMVEVVRARARRIASRLADRGCRVVWICPALPSDPVAEARDLPGLVELVRSQAIAPGSWQVKERSSDPATELAVAEQLREEGADAVHMLSFGAADSATIPWVSARLGFPAIVDVEFARAVCQRGDLVHAQGDVCHEWMDPERCHACCRTPCRRGPSKLGALAWSGLRWMGGWSPFPAAVEYRNRRDLFVSVLQSAVRIRVPDEAARQGLVDTGIQRSRVVVQDHDVVGDDLHALYRETRP